MHPAAVPGFFKQQKRFLANGFKVKVDKVDAHNKVVCEFEFQYE